MARRNAGAVAAPAVARGGKGRGEANAWWTTLRHQGVVLSSPVLDDWLPQGPASLPEHEVDRLRQAYQRFRADPQGGLHRWLDAVLETFLGHAPMWWRKEQQVPDAWKRPYDRPQRVLLNNGEHDARLLVRIDKDRVATPQGEPGRLGLGARGRRVHAQFAKLVRETEAPVGLLTNGHQFRLVHTHLDAEAWVEWDAAAWFEGGEGRAALEGLHALLGAAAVTHDLPGAEAPKPFPLRERIRQSRDRQADLSHVMGHQVREAVELLLGDFDEALRQMDAEKRAEVLAPLAALDVSEETKLQARYQAAIRVVMRLVVALYAESRRMLPTGTPGYHDSYSVEGLFHTLRLAAVEVGEEELEAQFGAWPRIQALSRLIHDGSRHKDLSVPTYGGQLFRPPGEAPKDEVLAALAALEHPRVRISDATVLRILKNLKIGRFKQGRQWITGPVDFSDLRTEYIGMMYEGLLDYDLRMAREEDGGIVVLNLGEQPALPLRVLQHAAEDPKRLAKLIGELNKKTRGGPDLDGDAEEGDDVGSDAGAGEEGTNGGEEAPEEAAQDEDAGDSREGEGGESGEEASPTEAFEREVHEWAYRVVLATGVGMPSKAKMRKWDPTRVEAERRRAARRLVLRSVPPHATYLVRWSGTRKGTGTFYTKPGLAVPTVRRTLEPLVYDVAEDGTRTPKPPQEILKLKVCDPAMGSGSFLVAAVRYLTQGLKESYEHHVFPKLEQNQPLTLDKRSEGILQDRLLPIRRKGDDDMEQRIEVELKRAVVEHCIYGVDINPLAVELGKLSLWVETMDPRLKFTFLDHKIKVGNSLIGAWLHEYMHYPVAAWLREGGDGPKGERTKRIKRVMKEQVKPELETIVRQGVNQQLPGLEPGLTLTDLTAHHRSVLERLHTVVDDDERERLWVDEVAGSEDHREAKRLMDRWCAVWFWPVADDKAPMLTPEPFHTGGHGEETERIIERLAGDRNLRFFHWEWEFPDVFAEDRWGFDAVFGNPPWDTAKPNGLEFFTRYRPEFRTYGKQEGLKIQSALFQAHPAISKEWLDYVARFRSFSNYVAHASNPWDGNFGHTKPAERLETQWAQLRRKRQSASERPTPYRHQGSADLNTYKLFAEQCWAAMRSEGRMGILSPAGLYSDYGTRQLRTLFLDACRWEWVYSFENRRRIFDIHSSYKYAVYIVQRGGPTTRTRFKTS